MAWVHYIASSVLWRGITVSALKDKTRINDKCIMSYWLLDVGFEQVVSLENSDLWVVGSSLFSCSLLR
mgnify:CR=1 FL=1